MHTMDSLRNVPQVNSFLASLPEKVLKEATVETISAGTTVVFKGEPVCYAYFILLGEMQVLNENDEGKPYYWLELRPFTVMSDLELLAESDIYAASVGTRVETTLLRVPAAVMRECMREDIVFFRRIVLCFSKNTYRNTFQREFTVYRSGYEKVAIFLASYCAAQPALGGDIAVELTRSELAARLGLSSKTVNRSIDRLKSEGTLTVEKRKIIITPSQCAQLFAQWSPLVEPEQ